MEAAEENKKVSVWLGSSLGIIKGVNLEPLRCTNYLPGGLNLSQTDKSHEILCMCRERETLYAGLRRGVVQAFDTVERRFTMECDVTAGSGTLVGVVKHGRILITCTNEGSLSFWPPGEEKWEIDVGSNTCSMAANEEDDLQVASGGRENPLKLWDGNNCKSPIFTAKNVKDDELGLRVPVWVNRLGFVPGSGPQPILMTGTGYGQVRMYDTRVQRRPVFSTKYGEQPITALDISPDGRYCVVGNSVGELGRLELRKKTGEVVGQYKGFGGSVTAVSISRDGTQLAASSLDRYLRVYSLHRPRLLHQVYVKLQCQCMVFCDDDCHANGSSEKGEKDGREGKEEEEKEDEEESDEEVWASMETVSETSSGGKRKRGVRQRSNSHQMKRERTSQ